jgi:hypothetical protein
MGGKRGMVALLSFGAVASGAFLACVSDGDTNVIVAGDGGMGDDVTTGPGAGDDGAVPVDGSATKPSDGAAPHDGSAGAIDGGDSGLGPPPPATGAFGWKLYTAGATNVAFDPTTGRYWALQTNGALSSITTSGAVVVTSKKSLPQASWADVAVDAQGAVYGCGQFLNAPLDFGSAGIIGLNGAFCASFVAKINADGSYAWAKSFAAQGSNTSCASCGHLALSSAGLGVGVYSNDDLTFEMSADAGTKTVPRVNKTNPMANVFIALLDPKTGDTLWARAAGEDNLPDGENLSVQGLGVSAAGDVTFTVGLDPGTTLHDATNTFTLANTSPGGGSIAVVKLAGADGHGVWASGLGGTVDAGSSSVAPGSLVLDSQGNAIVTGAFSSTLTVGTKQLVSHGSSDLLLAKLAAANGAPVWASGYGGSGQETGPGVAVDPWDEIVLMGTTYSSDFSFAGTMVPHSNGTAGALYTLKLDATGKPLWGEAVVAGIADTGSTLIQARVPVRMAINPQTGQSVGAGFFTGNADFGDGTLVYTAAGQEFLVAHAP